LSKAKLNFFTEIPVALPETFPGVKLYILDMETVIYLTSIQSSDRLFRNFTSTSFDRGSKIGLILTNGSLGYERFAADISLAGVLFYTDEFIFNTTSSHFIFITSKSFLKA
jgi:hypothetical protein